MNSSREKRRRKNHFDLQTVIHEPESINISRPVDPKTEKLIRPAKEFDVHLESDNYSEEKYQYLPSLHQVGPNQVADTHCTQITSIMCTRRVPARSPRAVSDASSARALGRAVDSRMA